MIVNLVIFAIWLGGIAECSADVKGSKQLACLIWPVAIGAKLVDLLEKDAKNDPSHPSQRP